MKGQPFFFDSNNFDDENLMSDEARANEPMFSPNEMEQMKAESFEEGRKAGFTESENSITNKTLNILQKVEGDMTVLFAAEEKRNKNFEKETLHLSASIFNKAFPQYMEAYGREELKNSITTALSDHMTPEKIKIELNPTLLDALSDFFKNQESTLQKKITLKPNDTLSDYDCRIAWEGGGLICNRENTTQKIFDILHQALAEHGISLHDETEQVKNDETDVSEETNTSGES